MNINSFIADVQQNQQLSLNTGNYLAAPNNSPQNGKIKPISGSACIAVGGYLGYKGLISGLRRVLGIRIEEHTSSARAAKDIIKNGIDPKYGGSGLSRVLGTYVENSQNYVHITGVHKDWFKTVKNPEIKALYPKVGKLPEVLQNPLRALFRKVQRHMYIEDTITPTGKTSNVAKCLKEFLFGGKTKTFYIGGTDEYFNTKFIPDTDDLALKSTECVKVAKTKIGATFKALKEFGLSGMKTNKSRVVTAAVAASLLFFTSYKMIKNGLQRFGIISKQDNTPQQKPR